MKSWVLAFIVLGLGATPDAHAQLDPSSTFLLNSGSSDPESTGLESGRYKTRPPRPTPRPPTPVMKAPEPTSPSLEISEEESSEQDSEPVAEPDSSLAMELMQPQRPVPSSEPSALEFELSSLLLYTSSSSSSWYRRYHSPGFGLKLGGKVWLSKDWGVNGFYRQSFGERVSDSFQQNSFVTQYHQDMGLGVSSRIFWTGESQNSQAEFGASYYERSRNVERSARMQSSWVTQGVLLSMKYRWAQTAFHGTGGYFDLMIYPRAYHKDKLADGSGLGRHQETYGVQLRLGRSLNLDRQKRVFWGLGASAEQNKFSGRAVAIEPDGSSGRGIYSIHSSVFLEFGIGWSQ